MNGYEVTLSTVNAAFDDCPGIEVARILRILADDLEAGGGDRRLRDVNGNSVGHARWME